MKKKVVEKSKSSVASTKNSSVKKSTKKVVQLTKNKKQLAQ